MGRKRIKEYLEGYVRVEVKGKSPERLVNLCLAAGFPIWDYSHGNAADTAYFCTTLSRYRDIHRLARRARCVPRVVGRIGLPFVAGKIRRRPIALLACAVLIFMFLYLSGFIWSIQVTGATNTEVSSIRQAAASAGLFTGARRSRILVNEIEDAILDANPDLAWAYVRFQGTLAMVEVVEKTKGAKPDPGDLVASRDGVIQTLLVLEGSPKVSIGQTVEEGTLLIQGDPNSQTGGARGSVTALTWYEAYLEVPLRKQVASRTGRKSQVTVYRQGSMEFIIWGRGNNFEWYEVEDYPVFAAPEGGKQESHFVNRVFYELQWTERTVTPEVAFEWAKTSLSASIQRQLPSTAKLVDLSYKIEVSNQEVIAVRVTGSAIEDIGVIRSWPKGGSEVDR